MCVEDYQFQSDTSHLELIINYHNPTTINKWGWSNVDIVTLAPQHWCYSSTHHSLQNIGTMISLWMHSCMIGTLTPHCSTNPQWKLGLGKFQNTQISVIFSVNAPISSWLSPEHAYWQECALCFSLLPSTTRWLSLLRPCWLVNVFISWCLICGRWIQSQ